MSGNGCNSTAFLSPNRAGISIGSWLRTDPGIASRSISLSSRLAPAGGLRLRGTVSMRKSDRAGIFIAAFLLLSVVCMSAVKYGMSLRYAAFCEIPLCWLACSPAIAPQKAALPPWPWRQRRQRSPRHGRCPARRAWCDEPKRRIKHYCSRGAWPAFSFKNEAWASFHRSTCAVSAS